MSDNDKEMPSRGFAKLDSGIVDSTIWMKPHDALRVWIALLAKSDSYGIVRIASPALAHQCFVTPERLDEIMRDFCSPDADSRSPDHDGCRLQRIEGGWLIVNYLKYRDMMQRKAASHAERQAKYREKLKQRDARVTRTVTRDTEADSRKQRAEEQKHTNNIGEVPSPVIAPEKTLTPQQAFVKAAMEEYANVGAVPPAAALLCKWTRDYLKGQYDWTLRELKTLGAAGHLSLGPAYVSKALQNIGNGNRQGVPAKMPDTRKWNKIEETL